MMIAAIVWQTPAVAFPLDPLTRAAIERGATPDAGMPRTDAADGFSIHLPVGRCGPAECPRAWYDLPPADAPAGPFALLPDEPSVASRVWTPPFDFPQPRNLALILFVAALIALRWQRRRRRTRRFV